MKNAILILTGCLLLLASCNDGTTGGGTVATDSTAIKKEEKEQRNKAAALGNAEAFQKLDAELAFKDVAQDYVSYGDGTGPVIKGLDSNKASVKSFMATLENLKGSNLISVADGNDVMIYGEWEGKFKSDYMGIKTAGKSFKFKDVDFYKFNDEGKIIEHRTVQDSRTIAAQMGLQLPKQ